MRPSENAAYRLGVVLVTISALLWSPAGFFTRLMAPLNANHRGTM